MGRTAFKDLTQHEREAVVTYNMVINITNFADKKNYKEQDQLLDVILSLHNNLSRTAKDRVRHHLNYGWKPEKIEDYSIDGKDLKEKYVIIKEAFFVAEFKDFKYRVAKATAGFGCSAKARGTAVFVTSIFDNDSFRVERYDVERFATEKEVEAIKNLLLEASND